MKQEPVKKMKLPKYAALLAVLTAVPMLTGCNSEQDLAGTTSVETEPEAAAVVFAGESAEPSIQSDGRIPQERGMHNEA